MKKVEEVLHKTDYVLLREQKIALIHHVNKAKRSFSIDCFDGLIEFLDNLQDAVVDDRIKTEYEVFGSTPR
ncbi:hypothetical protein KAR91_26760 [Candidatus Pacearchaeota archaeon]|nr:hypothetical protein [Candidatus Pacearchaeota archaeon]